jgi:predicted GIY-YIG superfamily endonuclease
MPASPPTPRETWVYHCMCSHNALVYVGVAVDVRRRTAEHRGAKDWWPTVELVIADLYPTRDEALAVERHTIRWGNRIQNINGALQPPTAPHKWLARVDLWVLDGHITVPSYWLNGDGELVPTTPHWAGI